MARTLIAAIILSLIRVCIRKATSISSPQALSDCQKLCNYESFLKIFEACTINGSRKPKHLMQLQNCFNSVADSYSSKTFTHIQTNTGVKKFIISADARLWKESNISGFENLKSIFWKIFFSESYQSTCAVQILSVKSTQIIDDKKI